MPDSFKTFEDPLISLYQSAVEEIGAKIDRRAQAQGRSARGFQRTATSIFREMAADIAQRELLASRGEVSVSSPKIETRDLSKIGIAKVCAEWGFRYLKASALRDERAISQLKDEFSTGTCDPEWLSTLEEYRRYLGPDGKRKAVPYVRPNDVGPRTIEVKAGARIALIGDWGTGAGPAVEVLNCVANDKPDAVVHLGDIYYSGTLAECEKNFLSIITPILRKESMIPVFTVSGNHDMYSGGLGFYDLISRLNPAPLTQPASFFCLRSADQKWQLLAMDTGLHDDNPSSITDAVTFLEEEELVWHCDRIKEFSGRTILLSHHQLFSAFSPIGPRNDDGKRSPINPRLLVAFQRMTEAKNISGWFWGHEHALSIYKPFAGLARGRCVGYGAVPVSIQDRIYSTLPGLDRIPDTESVRLGTRGGVYNHGYVMLQFGGDQCQVRYFETTAIGASEIYSEMFA